MIHSSTLTFLKALKKNNNKIWFDQNRGKYTEAKNDFEDFVSSLISKMILFDPDMKELSARNCTFRINRDIRFSRDKTPYKISLSSSFNRGGKKSIFAGYYFHLQPGGNSFAGGGLWMPEAVDLKKVRQEIDYCYPEFKKIVMAPAFQKQYGDLERNEDHMLVNAPKGYEKDHPGVDYLRMKSFVATRKLSDVTVISGEALKEISHSFKVLMPLVKFINRALE